MAKTVLLDELHLTVHAPRGLPEPEYAAIRRTLARAHFHAALDRAIRDVFSLSGSAPRPARHLTLSPFQSDTHLAGATRFRSRRTSSHCPTSRQQRR